MSEMFSDDWMKKFMTEWNNEKALSDALAQIGFSSVIAYGFEGEPKARGVLTVVNGKAESAGVYNGEVVNWDIRCSQAHWEKWIASPPGMMGLGTAFATGKMKFVTGDYGAMIKDPRMAGPFIKSFSVMGRV